MEYRVERDSMGEINVPCEAFWGAQTQRSFQNFPRDVEKMPIQQIYAITMIKKACAVCNAKCGKLDEDRKDAIVKACDEILSGKWDNQFPLTVWQTGSGTQTNMNVNEVIAHVGNEIAGEKILHPNDHVNMSQSSNDVFPAAMYLNTSIQVSRNLLPAIEKMIEALEKLEEENQDLIKCGRTHLQDATPVTLGQEISGWKEMIKSDYEAVKTALSSVLMLPIGGTAVGTGLNAPKNFDELVTSELAEFTGLEIKPLKNKFYGLASKGGFVMFHSALKTLATDVYKIASDIRLLSCGPRCGIGELIIPANEPGSSIMPGKVNPTQVESITMISIQVIANDVAISMANTQGQLQLNVYMPLMIYNMQQSVELLYKGLECFTKNLLEGLKANRAVIEYNLGNTLMLVTALSPKIGYDNAAKIAKYAYENNITLKESAMKLQGLSEDEYDKYVDPNKMV